MAVCRGCWQEAYFALPEKDKWYVNEGYSPLHNVPRS